MDNRADNTRKTNKQKTGKKSSFFFFYGVSGSTMAQPTVNSLGRLNLFPSQRLKKSRLSEETFQMLAAPKEGKHNEDTGRV